MPDTKNNLFLFEAIELRAELDARLRTATEHPRLRVSGSNLHFRHRMQMHEDRHQASDLTVTQVGIKVRIGRNYGTAILQSGQEVAGRE